MVMIFANPKVRNYLLENGVVYSYRKHHKKTLDGVRPQTGKDWATDRRKGRKIADINITSIEPVDALNMGRVLTRYARQSGFYKGHGRVDDAVSEWAKAINELNPNNSTAGWIYKVETRAGD